MAPTTTYYEEAEGLPRCSTYVPPEHDLELAAPPNSPPCQGLASAREPFAAQRVRVLSREKNADGRPLLTGVIVQFGQYCLHFGSYQNTTAHAIRHSASVISTLSVYFVASRRYPFIFSTNWERNDLHLSRHLSCTLSRGCPSLKI